MPDECVKKQLVTCQAGPDGAKGKSTEKDPTKCNHTYHNKDKTQSLVQTFKHETVTYVEVG